MEIKNFGNPQKLPQVFLWTQQIFHFLCINLHSHLVDAVLMTSLHDVCRQGSTIIVHGPESENLPPLGNFRDPPSFLPEGVLYSFQGVVIHINAANMQKYNFLYKPHAKFSHFWLQ